MSSVPLTSTQSQLGSAVPPHNQTISIASIVTGIPTSSSLTIPSSGGVVPVPSVSTSSILTSFNITVRDPSSVTTTAVAPTSSDSLGSPSVSSISQATDPVPPVVPTSASPTKKPEVPSPSTTSASGVPAPPISTSRTAFAGEPPGPSTSNTAVTSTDSAPPNTSTLVTTRGHTEPARLYPSSSDDPLLTTASSPTPSGAPQVPSAPSLTPTFTSQTTAHSVMSTDTTESNLVHLSVDKGRGDDGNDNDGGKKASSASSAVSTSASGLSHSVTAKDPVTASPPPSKAASSSSASSASPPSSSLSRSVSATPVRSHSQTEQSSEPHNTAQQPSVSKSAVSATPSVPRKATSSASGMTLSHPSPSQLSSTHGASDSAPSPAASLPLYRFSSASNFPKASPDTERTSTADASSSPDISNSGIPTPSADDQLTDTMSTSTVVEHPESTFARPVSIPVVVSGHTTLTAPPFITSLATSTEPGGSSVTVITHIIANPTSGLNQALASHSFFNNHGVVAGVFLVVGIVVAFVCGVLLWLCGCRRRQRRAAVLEDRTPALRDQDPFADPVEEPSMSMIAERRSGIDWDRLHLFRSDPMPDVLGLPSPARSSSHARAGLTSTTAGYDAARHSTVYPYLYEGYERPFSDYHEAVKGATPLLAGVASSTLASERSPAQAHTRGRSTPSLYPPSVPDDTADSLFEKEMQPPPTVSRPTTVYDAPLEPVRWVEPPRRQPQPYYLTTAVDYEPVPPTPTMSVSSHTQSSHLESPTTPAASDNGLGPNENGHYRLNLAGMKTAPGAFLRRNYSKRSAFNADQAPDNVSA